MTEKQYTEKIKQFIQELQTIFKLLQQKSLNRQVINLKELKEKMNKNIEEIYEFYKESSKILSEKIDIVYGMILKKIDELIQLGSGENISSSQFEKLFKEFETFYKDEIKILEIFIKDQIFSLQYKLNNKINDSLASFAIHEFENSYWYSILKEYKGYLISGAIILGEWIFIPEWLAFSINRKIKIS